MFFVVLGLSGCTTKKDFFAASLSNYSGINLHIGICSQPFIFKRTLPRYILQSYKLKH